jgi:hypothetical protein
MFCAQARIDPPAYQGFNATRALRRWKNMRAFYLITAIIGALLPLSQFVPWVVIHGLALPYMLQLAFGNAIAAFAWLDVLMSAAVLLVFMWAEGRRLSLKGLWLPTLGLCLVGVSFALPLFLWMREGRLLANNRL